MMIPIDCSVNGALNLRACRTDKFKAGMLSVSAVLPIRREDACLTTLMLSVLRRGTVRYPTLALLNRRLDYLFGTGLSLRNFYRGDAQIIGFAADLLDASYLPADAENLLYAVPELMNELLFHPLLDENGLFIARYVESEKELQCDAIRAQRNNPSAYAADRCRELLYADEPCGTPVLGNEEQVRAVTPERLTAHWKQVLNRLRLDCFYVGPADTRTVMEALKSAFSLPAVSPFRALPETKIVRNAKEERRFAETLPVSQGQLILGLRTGVTVRDPDYFACAVFNELLGVSPVARLFMTIREKMSLCYTCSSHYNIYKGTMLISCGLDCSNRAPAEAEIRRQIALIKDGDFTDGELDAAKKSLENSYRQTGDSPAALEGFFYGRALVGVNTGIDETRAGFAAVTREDVIRAARRTSVDTVYFLEGTLSGGDAEDTDNDEDD